jgi:hypothetical protein
MRLAKFNGNNIILTVIFFPIKAVIFRLNRALVTVFAQRKKILKKVNEKGKKYAVSGTESV